LKHGAKNGLFVVTLGWFVDSVRKNGNCVHLFSIDMFLVLFSFFIGGCNLAVVPKSRTIQESDTSFVIFMNFNYSY
jgi:hypothetical protein